MTYRLEIRPDAVIDIEEAIEWYDQRELGLGVEFHRQVLDAIDTLQQNPLAYRLRHRRKNVRWKLLDKFPYRVVFQIGFASKVSYAALPPDVRQGSALPSAC